MHFKKSILILLLTLNISANNFIYNLSEESRIKNIQKIDFKIKEADLNINDLEYLYKFKNYIKDNNLTYKNTYVLSSEIKELNKSFTYDQTIFKYKKFLTKLSYRLPEVKKLELIKRITLEESDYLIITEIFMDKIKKDCLITEKKRDKEKKHFLKSRQNLKYLKYKTEKCNFNNLTINGKREFISSLEKRIFKYLYLQKIYLNRNIDIESLTKKIKFYTSKEYQEFYPLRKKMTLDLIKDTNKKKVKKIITKKEEISNIDIKKNPFSIINENKEVRKSNNNDEFSFLNQ